MPAVNSIRGEVEAKIGSLTIVMVMTMDGLAKLSSATGCQTLDEVYRRLHGTEPAMVLAAIRQCTTKGEVDGRALGPLEAVSQALVRLTVDDLHDMQGRFGSLLAALLRPEPEGAPQGNGMSAQSG